MAAVEDLAISTLQLPPCRLPKYAQPGQEAIEIEVQLELKVIADVGLGLGFSPNVGKIHHFYRV